jgi:hypothetical protein
LQGVDKLEQEEELQWHKSEVDRLEKEIAQGKQTTYIEIKNSLRYELIEQLMCVHSMVRFIKEMFEEDDIEMSNRMEHTYKNLNDSSTRSCKNLIRILGYCERKNALDDILTKSKEIEIVTELFNEKAGLRSSIIDCVKRLNK